MSSTPWNADRLNPPLASPRLHLEPLVETHADAMYAAIADPALYTHIDHGPPASADRLREVYRQLQGRRSADGSELWLNWMIGTAAAPGVALGFVQATVLPDARAWVAYLLERSAWGHGYASEAVATMLAHLFERHRVRQAMACVEQDNRQSVALLRRLGFVRADGDALQGHTLTATEQLWLRAAP